MSTRGYVVRGFDAERPGDDHPSVWAVDGGRQTTDVFEFADTFPDLGLAVEAWRRMHDFPVGDITICAVGEDGTETLLPGWEEALAESERARDALRFIGETIESMTARPLMYGSPCCVEGMAGLLMLLRRGLLGSPESRKVRDGLLGERFGTSAVPAFCHLRDPDERTAAAKIGAFVAEWWKREREATGPSAALPPEPFRETGAPVRAAKVVRVSPSDKTRNQVGVRVVRAADGGQALYIFGRETLPGGAHRRHVSVVHDTDGDVFVTMTDKAAKTTETHEVNLTDGEQVGAFARRIAEFIGAGPATCRTCGEPYTSPPTARAGFCSDAFHLPSAHPPPEPDLEPAIGDEPA